MSISLGRFSWCLWAQGKDKEPISNGSSSSSSSVELGFGLTLTEPKEKKKKKRIASSRKWKSREERRTMRIDPEFDFVVLPTSSDGGDCLSGADSDDNSDMSIGWIEPLGPAFRRRDNDHDHDDDLDGGFAVLVPCYSPGCKELAQGSHSAVFRAITNLPIGFSPDCKNYMEQFFPVKALMPRERADLLL